MPTAYTASLYERDTSVSNYLTRCAHGVAFLWQHGDIDSLPDKIESPDLSYHITKVVEAETRLKALAKFTYNDKVKGAEQEHQERLQRWYQGETEAQVRSLRYIRMREKISAWEAPKELEDLKQFALDQLRVCGGEYPLNFTKPELAHPDVWYKNAVKDAEWHSKYHKSQYTKKLESHNKAEALLSLFKEALKDVD